MGPVKNGHSLFDALPAPGDTCAGTTRKATEMREFDLTGNDYVSIPFIGRDGAMDGVNVLHSGAAGVVEWAGREETPLLRLRILVDDVAVDLAAARWRRLDRWIPTFTVALPDGSEINGTICAAGGYPPARGFVVEVELDNRGRAKRALRVEIAVAWHETRLRIATPRPWGIRNELIVVEECVTLSAHDGAGPALALTGSHPLDIAGTSAAAPNGTLLEATLRQAADVGAARRSAVSFFIGAGREADGAAAAANSMSRFGADRWIQQARLDLAHTLRPAQDHRWAETLNRNLIFNRYYAVGRAIDDDRLYLLRSRSPYCPAPALFNEREALFWTLPALIIADPGIAREALMRMIEVHSERSGEYLRYLDGGAYETTFALDQFLLYAWAIDHYRTAASDSSVLDEPLVLQVLLETDSAAFMRLHPEHMLAATDVLGFGEAADYPYATLPNVLLHWFSTHVDQLIASVEGAEPPRFGRAASEIAAAIWQFCVSDVGGSMVLVSSASLDGRAAVYDDPRMSLALLPFLGFCSIDDPVWRSTMDFLRSAHYPLWRDGAVPGLSARRDRQRVRMPALCADLLATPEMAADALDRLQRINLDQGLAAETWDPADGSTSAPHNAALAGFLAWSLVRAAEPKADAHRKRKRRA